MSQSAAWHTTTVKKIPDHKKYITTQEFNKLATENFERLKQANLASKNDISCSVKKTDFDAKLINNTNKTINKRFDKLI